MEGDPELRETEAGNPAGRLTNPQVLSFERFPIRTRAATSTQSAWRLSVVCAEGQGAIIFIEISPEQAFFRGEGIFLGWSQQQMSAAYALLQPKSEDPPFEIPQLG